MKLYRVQARHLGAYIDHQVSCDTEEQVIPNFINELNTGKVEIQQENFFWYGPIALIIFNSGICFVGEAIFIRRKKT